MFAYSDATFIWYESLILIATLLRLLGLLCAEHLMIPQLRARVVASFLIVSRQSGGLEKCNVIAPDLVESFLSSGASAPASSWRRWRLAARVLASSVCPYRVFLMLVRFRSSRDSKQSARLVNKAQR